MQKLQWNYDVKIRTIGCIAQSQILPAVASAGSSKVAPLTKWHIINSGRLVQAVSCTKERHTNFCYLDFWPITLKFNRILEVVKVVKFLKNFIKLRATVHELSCLVLTIKTGENAENNTAVASAGNNNYSIAVYIGQRRNKNSNAM